AHGYCGTKSGCGFWTWTPQAVAAVQQRYERTLIAAARLLHGGDGTDGSGYRLPEPTTGQGAD
ncbi:MAG TPA: hypothetical protein VJR58_32495, partial [Vineibacter sp.]|nr:hypothetical protein [Vineibacter sp.]